MRPGQLRTLISVSVCAAMLGACTDSSSGPADAPVSSAVSSAAPTEESAAPATSTIDVSSTVPAPVPVVPAAPAPTPLSGATPTEQALALEQSVDGTSGGDPLAGWLAVYDALAIPVLDAGGTGIGTTADDPIGPTYNSIWMVSDTATRNAGWPLSDIVRLYVDDGTPSAELADLLLADLRAAASSADPQVALFGSFVRERALRTGPGSDLLDPAVTADRVYLDVATTSLVSWVTIRAMVAHGAEADTAPAGLLRPAGGSIVPAPQARLADTPCSESLGDEDTTYWINWLSNKIGSGFQLPGMESATKGLIEKLSELNPHIISKNAADRANTFAKRANLVGGILGLLMSISSLDVDVTQVTNPFERNRRAAQGNGKSTAMLWTVRMDIGSLPSGNQKALCAAAFVLGTLGVGFSFPSDGALPGVDLTFTGREGFAGGFVEGDAYVYQDANELKMTTGAGGEVTTTITGRAQRRDFPDSAQEWRRVFSIEVEAQVEPENLNSLLNIFFDGLTFGVAPDAYGLGSGAIDIAKTLHWSLGEEYGEIIDWQSGWKIDQEVAGYHFTGIICDIEKEFTISGTSDLASAGGAGTFTVTPGAGGTLVWSFDGSIGGAFGYGASGSGSLQATESGGPVVRLDASDNWIAHTPAGDGPMGEHIPTVDLLYETLDTEECTQ